MFGPRRILLLAGVVFGLLAIIGGKASGATVKVEDLGDPAPARATAQHSQLPDVDAFLGAWRSTRIAQVIPDHARTCLPSAGGARATDVQRGIAAYIDAIAESPLGAWLLEQAGVQLVLICQDPNTDLAAYYRSQMRLIGLFERLPEPAKIMFLAHELAHVPQHPRFSNDPRFGPQGMLVLHRMREATAEAVATRVLWQLQARGHPAPWQAKLASAYGDIARAFARAMAGTGEAAELRATRAAFDQWFGRPGRIDSYDARMLAHLVRMSRSRSTLPPPTRALTEAYLLGIGWYGGATFLAGTGPRLIDPYYAGDLSPGNAAQLEAILERLM